MLWCYYLGQVWPFEVLLSGPSLLFTKHCLSKNTITIRGFSTFFWKKIARANLRCYYLGQVGHFLSCSQLGPDNNTYLAQITTPQNGFCFQLFAFKNVLKYLFYSAFWTSTKIGQKKGQKNDNFSHFAKHRLMKKNRFVATPLFTKKLCFLSCWFWNQKHSCWTRKHNLKSGKKSKDKEKGFERKNKTGNHKKEKRLMKKINCNLAQIITSQHIYIYIWGRPQLVGAFYPKNSFSQFYRKKNLHLWGFFMFPGFFFFLLSVFFCLRFSSIPLLFDILKPKRVPTRWGLWHIYIYIHPKRPPR